MSRIPQNLGDLRLQIKDSYLGDQYHPTKLRGRLERERDACVLLFLTRTDPTQTKAHCRTGNTTETDIIVDRVLEGTDEANWRASRL